MEQVALPSGSEAYGGQQDPSLKRKQPVCPFPPTLDPRSPTPVQ